MGAVTPGIAGSYPVARRVVLATACSLASGLALATPSHANQAASTRAAAPGAKPPAASAATLRAPRPQAPVGPPAAAPAPPPAPGSLRARVLAIARSQLGQRENPRGSNCTKFGPCEAWCADFATWVWRHAGVTSIGRIDWVPSLVSWARQRGAWKPGYNNDPRPGDLIIFSGLHVGIVETVGPADEITMIAGNTPTNDVARRGPVPWNRGRLIGPAPISGYISPTVRSQAGAATLTALPRPTRAQMAAQDPQDQRAVRSIQQR
jgi:CHAP domain-containing protein